MPQEATTVLYLNLLNSISNRSNTVPRASQENCGS